MKATLFFFLFLLNFALSSETVGQGFGQSQFQSVEGEALGIQSITKGQYALLCIAFRPEAEGMLAEWWLPVYQNFISRKTDGFVVVEEIEPVNVWFMPVLEKGGKTAASAFSKKAKAAVEEDFLKMIALLPKPSEALLKELDVKDKKAPILVVIGAEGQILEKVSGAFDADKLALLEKALLKK